MSDIIQRLNESFEYISELDIDEWVVPALVEHYDSKIRQLAAVVYGRNAFNEGATLPLKAFTEMARIELREALITFIFKYQHWQNGRDVNTYLLKTLSVLCTKTKSDLEKHKKVNLLICPACKYENRKEYLVTNGEFWKCQECENQIEILSKMASDNKDILLSLESKIKLHKFFEIHTRKGFKCPECMRFIPESCNISSGIACPYPDCFYFGNINELEIMAHPIGQGRRIDISLQSPIRNCYNESNEESKLLDFIKEESVSPDVKLQINESFIAEIALVKEIINQQLDYVKRTNSTKTLLQKTLMYEAYSNMLDKYPEEMVSYLVHLKQNADFPLQARIFQEYVSLVQDALPYSIDDKYTIVSLLDDKLSLFEGVSEFDAIIRGDYTIPNNTKECYMGGRKFKNYGPCFIGLIIDITDESGESLKSKIETYSFAKIRMNKEVHIGTKVTVKHYRILSHYETGPLVFLQRCRKKLVNKIYFKINGEHRNSKD